MTDIVDLLQKSCNNGLKKFELALNSPNPSKESIDIHKTEFENRFNDLKKETTAYAIAMCNILEGKYNNLMKIYNEKVNGGAQ